MADQGYEKQDVNVRSLAFVSIFCISLLIIVIYFANEYFGAEREKMVYEYILQPESIPLRELRSREAEALNSYKLIDGNKGWYQIPIDRAMQLMADEAFSAKQSPVLTQQKKVL